MTPQACNIVSNDLDVYTSDDDNVSVITSGHSGSDSDDAPMIKDKVPLRKQFVAAETHKTGAYIDWVPSLELYTERKLQRMRAGIPKTALPDGFPVSIERSPCWTGRTLQADDFMFHLSQDDVAEVQQALNTFISLGLPKDEIRPETFPLPTLRVKLDEMCSEVHNGCGVAIIRGLDPLQYSLEENIIMYAGIASYIGKSRGKQDNDGNILVHIKDVGSHVAPDSLRQSPYANNAQPFHNDLGDIIALYCIDKAQTGGKSRLVPGATVYNELAASRPDLICEMAAPSWAFDKHDGTQSYHARPILFRNALGDGAFFNFSRRQLTGSTVSPRPSYLPGLTEGQAEALDAVHFIAEKHALEIQLERGDIQFSNNLALFHAREAFEDGSDRNKRHLVRMWLRNKDHAWPIPEELHSVWDEIYDDTRQPVWHMSPNHDRAHVINRHKSCHG